MPSSDGTPLRVRFAPSPTGLLHIGGLRTALYNYLLARQQGGAFLLRIEDTDRERYVPEAEPDILESLGWAGLAYDEGPVVGGEKGPYYQSQRKDLYDQYVQQLLDAGHAYYAFDTADELDAKRKQSKDGVFKYGTATRGSMTNALTLSAEEVQRRMDAGDEYVVRLNVPEGETVKFEDQIRGWVSFDTAEVDDQVLIKSDGMPTYHLANVVDDHLMGITQVIRGEEWLPSTPKHMLLYRFFGWTPPSMAHLPLILSPNGGKLSKRNADKMGIPVSVAQYREEGYEPEALINFLAFLGWNPGTEQELFSLEELAEAFSLDRVGSAGVQFNLDKLKWYNEQHLRALPADTLLDRARPFFLEQGYEAEEAYLQQVIALMQERVTFASELASTSGYFFNDPTSYDEEGLKKRWKDDSATLLAAYANRLERVDPLTAESVELELRALAEEHEAGAGRIIHPVRLAVSGVTFGPSLFHMMEVLGQETCVRRIRKAVEVLG